MEADGPKRRQDKEVGGAVEQGQELGSEEDASQGGAGNNTSNEKLVLVSQARERERVWCVCVCFFFGGLYTVKYKLFYLFI